MSYSTNYSLADETASELLDIINTREDLKPGSKLPNENELSSLLKVSRGTLREAIRILATQNILVIKRGLGTFISESTNTSVDVGLAPITSIKIGLRDLMEMRLINEPECAYLAAIRATDKEIDKIMELGKLLEDKMRKGEDRIEEEQKFHVAIAKATHNEFMKNLIPIINKSVYKEYLLYIDKAEEYAEFTRDHMAIMEFIKNRNPEGARTAMKLHILRVSSNQKLD
jgi:DNA-binding FadR family transcriptional regulator